MVSEFYPGWNIRLYYDLEDTDPLLSDLCEVACKDANIDLCHVKNIPALGDVSQVFAMNWRFFPMLDPQVSIIHISKKIPALAKNRGFYLSLAESIIYYNINVG